MFTAIIMYLATTDFASKSSNIVHMIWSIKHVGEHVLEAGILIFFFLTWLIDLMNIITITLFFAFTTTKIRMRKINAYK